ncbi:MAG: hypothetical protein HQK54_14640, partial [Oligoflexales bacterium]|nr:hypothetical protein [Oligoflexales bacterium]
HIKTPSSRDIVLTRLIAIIGFMLHLPLRPKNVVSMRYGKPNPDDPEEWVKIWYENKKSKWWVHIKPIQLKNKHISKSFNIPLPSTVNKYLDPYLKYITGANAEIDENELKIAHTVKRGLPQCKNDSFWGLKSLQFSFNNTIHYLKIPNKKEHHGFNPHFIRHIVATDCKECKRPMEEAATLLLDDTKIVIDVYVDKNPENELIQSIKTTSEWHKEELLSAN